MAFVNILTCPRGVINPFDSEASKTAIGITNRNI
jgi:hypothetical protein